MKIWVAVSLAFLVPAIAIASTASRLGVYTTDSVPALTLGYVDQFGAANGGQLSFKGSTSGTTILKPAAAAGSGTVTLPTATGTLQEVGAAVTGPVPVVCGATCTIGTASSGGTVLLDQASGSVATLPGATGTGNTYRVTVSTTASSVSHKILTNPITDTIIGTAIGENAGTAKIFVGNASTYHSLQMPFAGTQPSGGFAGDTFTCTDIASTIWLCNGTYQAGTTPTTPYSASTS